MSILGLLQNPFVWRRISPRDYPGQYFTGWRRVLQEALLVDGGKIRARFSLDLSYILHPVFGNFSENLADGDRTNRR